MQLGYDICGRCFGFRHFILLEEEVKALEWYKEQLQREIITLEERIKRLKPVEEVEV